jgi:hypothetical protein
LTSELVNIRVHVLLKLSYAFGRERVRYNLALPSVGFSITGTEKARADGDEGIVEVTDEKLINESDLKEGVWIYLFKNPEPWPYIIGTASMLAMEI